MTRRIGGDGGAFEDTDGDDVAELLEDHADYQGGDARNIGDLDSRHFSVARSRSAAVVTTNAGRGGIYGAQHPQAIYAPDADKTFIVFRGDNSDPYATVYDHQLRTFGREIHIGTNPLPNTDNHGTPSLAIDADGYLYVFYGAHGDYFQFAKSANPYDIGAWTDLGPLDTVPAGTYPFPQFYNGDLYAMYRAGPSDHDGIYPDHPYGTIIRSTDGGQTWTDLGPIVDTTGVPETTSDFYPGDLTPTADGLHLSWTIARGSGHDGPRQHAYHAIYDPDADDVQGLDGTSFGSTLTWSEMDGSVIDASDGEMKAVKHVINGDEVHLSHTYDNAGICEQRHTWWDGAAWQTEQVAGAEATSLFCSGMLRFTDEGELEAHISTSDGAQVSGWPTNADYEIFTKSAGAWDRQATVASAPEFPVARMQTVQNGPEEFATLCVNETRDKDYWGHTILAIGELGDNRTATTAGSLDSNMRLYAYLGADQAHTSANGREAVLLDIVDRNPLNEYDATTGEFAPRESGWYHVEGSVTFAGAVDQDRVWSMLWRTDGSQSDGSEIEPARAQTTLSGTANQSVRFSGYAHLKSGKTYDLRGWNRDSDDTFKGGDMSQSYLHIRRVP